MSPVERPDIGTDEVVGGEKGTSVELVVPREGAGARLDRFVASAMGISRAEVQRWIERGRVNVAATLQRSASATLRAGDKIQVRPEAEAPSRAMPDDSVRFQILYVDDAIVVLDKPVGLVVHPARGHLTGTLVNGLLALNLFRLEDFAGVLNPSGSADFASSAQDGEVPGSTPLPADRARESEHARPGIVHRLDKGTSGVMVVARTAEAREALKAQFQSHSIEREYEAIVVGEAETRTIATLHGRHPHDRLRFSSRVARGKSAVTHVQVMARLRGATHVACRLETGRTHQIRVHLAETGNPVIGDPLYGKPARDPVVRAAAEALGHQALHARVLGMIHPTTGLHLRFQTPPPPDFQVALAYLSA